MTENGFDEDVTASFSICSFICLCIFSPCQVGNSKSGHLESSDNYKSRRPENSTVAKSTRLKKKKKPGALGNK